MLQKGLNYDITPKKIPVEEIIVETGLHKAAISEQTIAKVVHLVNKQNVPKPNVTKQELTALK